MQLAPTLNFTLSLLTVIAQIFIVTLSVFILLRKKSNPKIDRVLAWVGKNALPLGFSIALIAMLGSLAYSDILGYEPCKLCWYQRILMYPMVLLLGVAWFKKDRSIIPYVFGMAVIGELIAIYHYTVQLGLFPAPCTVSGYSVSCAQKFVLQFGYITIPLMAFSAFLLIMYIMLLGKNAGQKL